MRQSSGYREPVALVEDSEAFEATYATMRHIGAGASGRVVLVEHRRTRAKCVLKKIPMTSMKDAGPVMKEVTVLAQLDHPNITRYHGSWHADGCLNILMEYADGGSLADALRARADDKAYLDEDAIMDWFIQIARAVHYIHERKIVHRDLKAQNVLLTKRGLIKVCDFGISKVLEETSGGSAGLASTCIGTPYYLSPEIVEAKKYGLPTDLWSLGVLLYEMAALRKPFEADSLPALAMRITRASYDELPECYSPELRALVRALLQREPQDRPTSHALLCDPFVQANEDRFNAQLAELAELAQGLASARASFASPPHVQRASVLTPPRPPQQQPAGGASAPPAQQSGLDGVGDATLLTGAQLAGVPPDARPSSTPVAAPVVAVVATSAAASPVAPAPSALPDPTLGVHAAPRTVGRAGGLSALHETGGESAPQLPARGVSFPGACRGAATPAGPAGPGFGAGQAAGRASVSGTEPGCGSVGRSVGRLLHAAVGSPQAERAIACALRHELVLEKSGSHGAQPGACSPSELRASLEDNLRFSLNMQALESNLAVVASEESSTPEVGAARSPHDAPRADAAARQPEGSARPSPLGEGRGSLALGAHAHASPERSAPDSAVASVLSAEQPSTGRARDSLVETPAREAAREEAEDAHLRAPLSINNSGFITTRRSRRGERSKARPTVSRATFAPLSPAGDAAKADGAAAALEPEPEGPSRAASAQPS